MEWFSRLCRQVSKVMIIIAVFSGVVFLVLFVKEVYPYVKQSKNKNWSEKTPKFVVGYLKEGAMWVDKNDRVHYNEENTKIEIISGKIVMSDGNNAVPFEFLEGENIGIWGYTSEKFLTRIPESVPKSEGLDRIIRATPRKICACVVNVSDIDTVVKFSKLKDETVYNLLNSTIDFFVIEDETRVRCYYGEEYKKFVPVIFYEGEYKGRRAYVLKKRLQEE